MSKELELYKAFIDGLVERKDSITARWVRDDGFPRTDDNKAKNDFLAMLTPEQKGVLSEMLQDGESYPNDYFESLHYDFISRCDGDEWPE